MKGASEWKWLLPLLLCGGSAFVYVLPVPPSTAYLWCRMWTAFGIGMVVACLCLSVLSKKKDLLSVDVVLRAFFFVGVLEMLYALLQGMGFLPSGNPYYRFTGSFNNPAVFAMFMSLCIPIGLHFVARSSASFRLPWGILTFCAGISLAFSSSRTGLLAGACSVFIMCVSWSDKVKAFLSDWKKVFFLLAVLALSLGGLYYCRQDSADGRLLAWIVSARMVAERPIIGWGRGGFDAFYMPAQADYFSRHPDSSYLLLADNLSHPFNEFLWFAIQYGVVGLAFLLFALGWVLKSVWDGRDVRKRLWISLFSSFFVWSMFSYPFQIPFMRLAMVYLLTVCVYPVFASSRFAHSLALCILGVLLFGVASMTLSYKKEVQWVDVQESALAGERLSVLPRYVELYEDLKGNGAFLYNYGAELHLAGRYAEALEVLQECTHKYNDYNVQMLMANCYRHLGRQQAAIETLRYANQMIPNRFLPLYHEMRIHWENGDSLNACKVARTIMGKPVKIKKSAAVKRMLQEANKCLNCYSE